MAEAKETHAWVRQFADKVASQAPGASLPVVHTGLRRPGNGRCATPHAHADRWGDADAVEIP
jgi:hypothetical protein